MQTFRRRVAGVTLFESLLVLFALSLMAVAFYQYTQHQKEVAAAQAYGQKLYIFGEAVRNYVYSSPSLYTTGFLPGPNGANQYDNPPIGLSRRGTVTTMTIQGVDWVKRAYAGVNTSSKQPFLADDFTFKTGLTPFILAVPDDNGAATDKQGDLALTTVITFDKTKPDIPPGIAITAGLLYKPGKQNPNGPVLNLAPAFTQDAMTYANTLFTPLQGAPALTYSFPYIDIATGNVNTAAKVGGSMNVQAKTDAYLKTDGTNKMIGNVSFQAPAGQVAQVLNPASIQFGPMPAAGGVATELKGVNKISLIADSANKPPVVNFDPANGGNINNITRLSFDGTAGSEIKKLKKIVFIAGGKISNLENLSFDGAGSLINNLGSIVFKNGSVFKGITTNVSSVIQPGVADTRIHLGDYDVCTLAWAEWGSKGFSSPAGYGGCTLVYVPFNNLFFSKGWYLSRDPDRNSNCQARCLTYTK